MDALLVAPKNKSELKFLIKLLNRMKVKNRVITEEEMEDYVLLKKMLEVDITQIIDNEQFMKKLKS